VNATPPGAAPLPCQRSQTEGPRQSDLSGAPCPSTGVRGGGPRQASYPPILSVASIYRARGASCRANGNLNSHLMIGYVCCNAALCMARVPASASSPTLAAFRVPHSRQPLSSGRSVPAWGRDRRGPRDRRRGPAVLTIRPLRSGICRLRCLVLRGVKAPPANSGRRMTLSKRRPAACLNVAHSSRHPHTQ